jgi:hypothetical protein
MTQQITNLKWYIEQLKKMHPALVAEKIAIAEAEIVRLSAGN